VAAQRLGVIGTNGGFILDDGNAAHDGGDYTAKVSDCAGSACSARWGGYAEYQSPREKAKAQRAICHRFATFDRRFAPFGPVVCRFALA
jgi:hypothetical protein